MKFSKLSFAAVGILLGTSGLVVSCGGGNAVTPVSEPQPPTQPKSSLIDGSDTCLPHTLSQDLSQGNEGAGYPQPRLSQPRQNYGSGDAQPIHDKADCILPELK